MNDRCISFEPHIRIWSGKVTFNMVVVASLDSIINNMIRRLAVQYEPILAFESEMRQQM